MVVLKDRPFLKGDVELDLGHISITNHTFEKAGRFKGDPTREVFVNVMDIDIKQVKIDYNQKQCQITPPFDIKVQYEALNYTP